MFDQPITITYHAASEVFFRVGVHSGRDGRSPLGLQDRLSACVPHNAESGIASKLDIVEAGINLALLMGGGGQIILPSL